MSGHGYDFHKSIADNPPVCYNSGRTGIVSRTAGTGSLSCTGGRKEWLKMDAKYTTQQMILTSRCDASGKLGYADCFALFMDIATEHAEKLGIGLTVLGKENKFWLTVKTKIRFLRRPRLTETVEVATWPEQPEGTRCNRDYTLTRGDEILALGKTQWALMSLATGKLENAESVYPPELEIPGETAIPEPFERIDEDFPEPPFGMYTVRSTDIDVGGHMNNVSYVRALLGLFSTEQWKSFRPGSIEVHYKSPCLEGDVLAFRKRQQGDTLYLKAETGGKTVLLAALCRAQV